MGAGKGDISPSQVPALGHFHCRAVLMAFAPRGPEASFFQVLDQHRASLLAALRKGGGEPAGWGTHLASRYEGSFWGEDGGT